MKEQDFKSRTLAGIVSYQPDIERLQQNIEAVLRNGIQSIVVVDNGSGNRDRVDALTKNYPNITLIQNEKNEGIACALNQLFQEAERQGCFDWVLTLDQDSIIDDVLLEVYGQYYTGEEDVVSISSLWWERTYGEGIRHGQEPTEYVNRCITSGNLVQLQAWRAAGGFENRLFIDMVDYDFCYRLLERGYRILRINRPCILHELGKPTAVKFLGKERVVLNHSAFRKYYIVRNYLYLLRNYDYAREDGDSYGFLLRYCVKAILLEKEDRWNKLLSILRGVHDGLRMKRYPTVNGAGTR